MGVSAKHEVDVSVIPEHLCLPVAGVMAEQYLERECLCIPMGVLHPAVFRKIRFRTPVLDAKDGNALSGAFDHAVFIQEQLPAHLPMDALQIFQVGDLFCCV